MVVFVDVVATRERGGSFQNLGLYAGGVEHALTFSEQNQARQQADYFLRPLDIYVVNPVTAGVTDNIALPLLKIIYDLLGELTVFTVRRYVSNERAQRIEDARYDPISTESLCQLSKRVQEPLRSWSLRSPVQVSLIGGADTCSIVAARHIYIWTRDMERVLGMPEDLRSGVDRVYRAANEEIIWPLVEDLADEASKRVVGTPSEEEKKTESWGSWFTRGATRLAIHATAGVSRAAATRALNNVRQGAHDAINRNEREARRQMVGIAVHSVCRTALATCIRGVVRAGAVITFNKMTEHVIVAILPDSEMSETIAQTTSLCITVAGTLLWLRCVYPIASQLHDSYREDFDPEASTLKEVASLFDSIQIDQLVHAVCTNLEDQILFGKPYLQNFKNRVAANIDDLPEEDDLAIENQAAEVAQ